MDKILNIVSAWSEKHYGSSDGETNGADVVCSCMTMEDAEKKLQKEKNKTIKAIKEELKEMMYSFKNKWLEVKEDINNINITYDNEKVRLVYDLSIRESNLV